MSGSERKRATDALSRRELLGGGFLRTLRGERRDRERARAARPAPAPGAPIVNVGHERRGAEVPAGSRVRKRGFPVLRPPGAVAEPEFLERCTRCNACRDACPHGAIVPAPARFREAAGTPMIDPFAQPCLLCIDTPCVTACEPRALVPELPPAMGRAMIDTSECLAHRMSPCSVCVDRCPVEGAMHLVEGRPLVEADACTGCGICQHVCPAPNNAIVILPALERPAPPKVQGRTTHVRES